MKKGSLSVFIPLLFLSLMCISCIKKEDAPVGDKTLRVVTTLFPLYDFARNVGGELVQVELLLPPGMEPHSFEPRPADIRTISDADVLLYTGKFMEPWVGDLLKGLPNKNLLVVDTSDGIVPDEGCDPGAHQSDSDQSEAGCGHFDDHGGIDPHIWLDLANARIMVRNILNGFLAKDPGNSSVYMRNAEAYTSRLSKLDEQFHDKLASCRKDTIVHAGHFAFGYLARRYHLRYLSAYRGFSPNAEPVPGDIMALIQTLRKYRLNYVFFEELVSPAVAQTIARETDAHLLMLHGAHNISKDDWSRGATFLSLMEMNLKNLSIGLSCQ